MGSTASISYVDDQYSKRIPLTTIDILLRHVVGNGSAESLSFDGMIRICSSKFDLYLSFYDDGCKSIQTIEQINSFLQLRGMRSVLANQADIVDYSTIHNYKLILVFITEAYVRNVKSRENLFDSYYISERHFIPVVMDSTMRDKAYWGSKVGLLLGGSSYFDFSTDQGLDMKMEGLYSHITEKLGTSVEKEIAETDWSAVFEKFHLLESNYLEKIKNIARNIESSNGSSGSNTTTSSSSNSSNSSVSSTIENDDANCGIADWLVREVKVVPKAARRTAQKLLICGIDSTVLLKQALRREGQLLAALDVSPDDEEDILMALGLPCQPLAPGSGQPRSPLDIVAPLSPPFSVPDLPEEQQTDLKEPHKRRECSFSSCAIFRGHISGVWSIIELADGLLCSGSADKSIRIWSPDRPECLKILTGHAHSVGKSTCYDFAGSDGRT